MDTRLDEKEKEKDFLNLENEENRGMCQQILTQEKLDSSGQGAQLGALIGTNGFDAGRRDERVESQHVSETRSGGDKQNDMPSCQAETQIDNRSFTDGNHHKDHDMHHDAEGHVNHHAMCEEEEVEAR